eukprot:7388824-Prymnesium_polylepis.2
MRASSISIIMALSSALRARRRRELHSGRSALNGVAYTGCIPAKGPDREMQREERDADNERHEDPGLLSIFANEQNPAYRRPPTPYGLRNYLAAHALTCQCQLAAHLERLPPERVLAIIIGQEGSRPAERCRFAGEQRSTACPK